jgi:survival of motor neuron protein-interacting protein 1
MDTEAGEQSGSALPVCCEYSEAELAARMAAGVEAESAGEYLARARLEAARLPSVVEVDAARLREIRAESAGRVVDGWVTAPPPVRPAAGVPGAPSAAWRKAVVESFAQTRQLVRRWDDRASSDEVLAAHLPALPKRNNYAAWQVLRAAEPPALRLVLALEHKSCTKVLKDIIYAGDEAAESARGAKAAQFSAEVCVWLWALLARTDRPLGVGMEAHLRSLLRALYTRREMSDGRSVDVLIAVLEDYFRV